MFWSYKLWSYKLMFDYKTIAKKRVYLIPSLSQFL